MRRIKVLAASLALYACSGCALHQVKYTALSSVRIEPVAGAKAIDGTADEFNRLMDQSQLPHNSRRQQLELQYAALRSLTSQLGADDYLLIGVMKGGGNGYASKSTLREAMCKKAASEGGDVVLLFGAGVSEQPFSYTTPGYSTTNLQGSAYRVGQNVYGNATAQTYHYPGQTISGVRRRPFASGFVLKYSPGAEARRAKTINLNDGALKRMLAEFDALDSANMTLDQYHATFDEMLARAAKG